MFGVRQWGTEVTSGYSFIFSFLSGLLYTVVRESTRKRVEKMKKEVTDISSPLIGSLNSVLGGKSQLSPCSQYSKRGHPSVEDLSVHPRSSTTPSSSRHPRT